MKDVVFVTYTHPRQRFDAPNRTLVARHIGVHFRNRSAPVGRKRLDPRQLSNLLNRGGDGDTIGYHGDVIVSSVGRHTSQLDDEHDDFERRQGSFALSRDVLRSIDARLTTNNQLQAIYLPSQPSDRVFDHFGISGWESDIVTWYLNEVPSMAYGTSGHGLFCPGRDIAWYATMACPQAINWSLIDAEGYVIANQPPECDCSSLIRRRTLRKVRAYGVLREMLNNPATQCSDETLTLVCAAIAIEARFFDRQATRAHVKGLNLLIAKRGGVHSMLKATVTFGHPLAGIGFLLLAELETSSHRETLEVTSKVLGQLNKMQNHPHLMLSNQHGTKIHAQIRELLNPDVDLPLLPKQLARFITLYVLNVVIFEYGKDGRDCTGFITRLNQLVDGSMAVDPMTRLSMVREEILTWIIAKSWADVETLLPSDKSWQDREVRITESAIDALRVWSRLKDTTKETLLQALYSWLFENELGRLERPKFSKRVELDKIQQDATSSYYEECVRDSA